MLLVTKPACNIYMLPNICPVLFQNLRSNEDISQSPKKKKHVLLCNSKIHMSAPVFFSL